mmetsp:Transcript_70190/g.132396  ORF Transcript_70190/g.132396 Transcript_70190/m.132396 type:complete len:217 (+) Transcript_70190:46-696(+)
MRSGYSLITWPHGSSRDSTRLTSRAAARGVGAAPVSLSGFRGMHGRSSGTEAEVRNCHAALPELAHNLTALILGRTGCDEQRHEVVLTHVHFPSAGHHPAPVLQVFSASAQVWLRAHILEGLHEALGLFPGALRVRGLAAAKNQHALGAQRRQRAAKSSGSSRIVLPIISLPGELWDAHSYNRQLFQTFHQDQGHEDTVVESPRIVSVGRNALGTQ